MNTRLYIGQRVLNPEIGKSYTECLQNTGYLNSAIRDIVSKSGRFSVT